MVFTASRRITFRHGIGKARRLLKISEYKIVAARSPADTAWTHLRVPADAEWTQRRRTADAPSPAPAPAPAPAHQTQNARVLDAVFDKLFLGSTVSCDTAVERRVHARVLMLRVHKRAGKVREELDVWKTTKNKETTKNIRTGREFHPFNSRIRRRLSAVLYPV